ncbi:MAG: Tm-1-like ATP-binding domain-containing protein [Chloroflexota bacterium]
MTKTVLVIGTFDTKGEEYKFCIDLIQARGLNTVTMNAGIVGEPPFTPDVSAEDVAVAGGTTLQDLRDGNDRGTAVVAMSQGAAKLAAGLVAEGKIDGAFSMGGTGGSSLAAAVYAILPVGMPKVLISTAAAGNVAPYVGVKDVTMMYSIVDVAGLNSISRQIFTNGVGAICGMVEQSAPPAGDDKPLITASMYGVTTPCVTRVREKLEEAGYEVLVFHAVGSGGRSMEALIQGGYIKGVADITTHELIDDLVEGIHGAGPERMNAAAETGTPQIVSLGALDMGTYGPVDTVPAQYKDRKLHVHNASITIMESSADERIAAAKVMVEKLNKATGPTAVFIPLKGTSMMDNEEMPFHTPEARNAMFDIVRNGVSNDNVELIELDLHINDPEFADAMSAKLIASL